MTATFEFDTTGFEASHGRKPKGWGVWAFAEKRNPAMEDVIWSPSMTYGDAKKWLTTKLRAEGVEGFFVVHVLP